MGVKLRDKLVEVLKHEGCVYAPERTTGRYAALTNPAHPGHYYFIGKAGALRSGPTASSSVHVNDKMRMRMLEKYDEWFPARKLGDKLAERLTGREVAILAVMMAVHDRRFVHSSALKLVRSQTDVTLESVAAVLADTDAEQSDVISRARQYAKDIRKWSMAQVAQKKPDVYLQYAAAGRPVG